ncbi:hypothetical protein DL766_010211 [Monosporascus sp. MC13-8B]|nr:hypothetical protein DL766_010211 [Monosporascus sp. MC13-8B]
MVAQTDPDSYSSGQTPRFLLRKGTPKEYDIFEFYSVHPDHHWVYWKKGTFRERLVALKSEFKPSNNARIYEVDARYKQALKTNRIQMDTWLSTYWRAYTEAEELEIPAVAGYHGHLDFLKAVNTYSPDFSVTQTAAVEEAMFEGKDPSELPPVQKLVERFRSHMRLRKAQGVTAEQLSRGAFGVTLNGETPDQTGTHSDNRNNGNGEGNNRPTPKCFCGELHLFKECPYLCEKVRPSGWTEDPEIRNVTTGYSLKRSTLLDTCSDFHVGNRKADFLDLHPPKDSGRLLAGGKYLDIVGEGTRRITLTTPTGRSNTFLLKNCLYVPELHTNLASHRLFQKAGIYWNHETDVVYHKATGTKMAKVSWIERQPVIHHVRVTPENDEDDTVPTAFAAAEEEPTATVPEDESDPEDEVILESEDEDFVPEPLIQEFLPPKLVPRQKLHGNSSRLPLKPLEGDATLWHQRLAHLGPRALEKVVQAVTGAKIHLPSAIQCQDCQVAKARKKISRRQPVRESKPFSTICADLFEFSNAFDGRTKALIITCPVIRARISYTLKRKKHALTALMNAVAFLERQFHIKVKTVVSDGETSFGNKFRRWLLDTGISHEPSPPYTKEPAGVQERAGGVIITKARCLIISSNLPSDLWPEAVEAATYITNRTPVQALGWKTPIQVFNEWLARRDRIPIPEEGLKASVANIVLFGSEAYALTEAARRGADRLKKMDPRAYIGYLVGYVASNIYRVWIPSQQRVITVRDVTFDETKKYQDERKRSSLEIAELNDQIDSILIPPTATTFLGTSRAVFSSDPLDTGITGGVDAAEAQDEPEEVIYDTIVVATDPPDQEASQEARGVEADEAHDSYSDEDSFDSAVSSNPEESPSCIPDKTDDSDREAVQPCLPTPEATPGLEENDSQHHEPSPDEAQSPLPSLSQPRQRRTELDFLDQSAILESGTRSGRRREPPSANTSHRLEFEELNTYPTAFNVIFSTAIKHDRLYRTNLPAAPKNWQEAMQHKYAEDWKAAALKEWDQINRVKRLVAVTLLQKAIQDVGPNGILPLMWVFTYKFNKHGVLQKFKARVVVRGDLQPRGDLNAYASTLAGKFFRMLMAVAARFNLELRQLDAVNAFLHSDLDKLVYVRFL